jgi:hypothetical protein
LRETVEAVEENPEHPWHGLLDDMTVNACAPLF